MLIISAGILEVDKQDMKKISIVFYLWIYVETVIKKREYTMETGEVDDILYATSAILF